MPFQSGVWWCVNYEDNMRPGTGWDECFVFFQYFDTASRVTSSLVPFVRKDCVPNS